jgi:SanA protein
MKRFRRIFLIILIIIIALIFSSNAWVVISTQDSIYSNISTLPEHGVALVLGTSHRLTGGGANPFFEKRMDTAGELYRLKKIRHFLLSGDNRTKYYNEPAEMRKALLKRGVPASAITLDYAGLRTLDSIVRSKEIFGQDSIVIITQSFHSHRALFISRHYNIAAVAMIADEPGFGSSVRVRLREYFARPKAILDLYVLNTSPRHLGKKEEIKVQ